MDAVWIDSLDAEESSGDRRLAVGWPDSRVQRMESSSFDSMEMN